MNALYRLNETEWNYLRDQFVRRPIMDACLHMQVKRYIDKHEKDHLIVNTSELKNLIQWLSLLSDEQKIVNETADKKKRMSSKEEVIKKDISLYSKLIWLLKKRMNETYQENRVSTHDRYHESV